MKTFLRNIAVSYTTIKSLSFHENDYLIFIGQLLRQCLVRGRKYNTYIPGRFPQEIPTECENIYIYIIIIILKNKTEEL